MAVRVLPHPLRGRRTSLAGVPDFEVDPAWRQQVCVGQIQKYLTRLVPFLRAKGIAKVALGLKVDGEPGFRRREICVIYAKPTDDSVFHAMKFYQAIYEEFGELSRCDYGDCMEPGKDRPRLDRCLCDMHTRMLVKRIGDPEGRPRTWRGEYQGGGFDTNRRRH